MKIGAKEEAFGGLAMWEAVHLISGRACGSRRTCFSTTQPCPPDCKIFEFAEKHPHWTQTSVSTPLCVSAFLSPGLPFLGSPELWFSRIGFPATSQFLASVSAHVHRLPFPAPITSQNEGVRCSNANCLETERSFGENSFPFMLLYCEYAPVTEESEFLQKLYITWNCNYSFF